jgi:hypothetical protein
MPTVVTKKAPQCFSVEDSDSTETYLETKCVNGDNDEEPDFSGPVECGDKNVQRQCNEMMARNHKNKSRQKRDRALRARYSNAFKQLRKLLDRVQKDTPTLIHDSEPNDNVESLDYVQARVYRSNMNSLIRTNNTLLALIEINREFKREKLRLKKKLRKIGGAARSMKNENVKTFTSQVSQRTAPVSQEAQMIYQHQKV